MKISKQFTFTVFASCLTTALAFAAEDKYHYETQRFSGLSLHQPKKSLSGIRHGAITHTGIEELVKLTIDDIRKTNAYQEDLAQVTTIDKEANLIYWYNTINDMISDAIKESSNRSLKILVTATPYNRDVDRTELKQMRTKVLEDVMDLIEQDFDMAIKFREVKR